jgi:hypothetical protein
MERALQTGAPFRHVSAQYGVSTSSLFRHRQSTQLAKSRNAAAAVLQEALARLEAAHAALSWSHPMTIVAVLRALVLVVTLLAQARHNK